MPKCRIYYNNDGTAVVVVPNFKRWSEPDSDWWYNEEEKTGLKGRKHKSVEYREIEEFVEDVEDPGEPGKFRMRPKK